MAMRRPLVSKQTVWSHYSAWCAQPGYPFNVALLQVDQAETEDGETLSGQKANVIEALQSQMSTVTVSAHMWTLCCVFLDCCWTAATVRLLKGVCT